MAQLNDVGADRRLEAQRQMAQGFIERDTRAIGFEQEETLGMDEIARLSQDRYGFSAFMRIFVGDRVTGMVLAYDEEGKVRRFRDIDGQMKDFYVTREYIEPCSLEIFSNVTRRVSKDKAIVGPDFPGSSILEKNGPLAHHIGSGQYGASIQNYQRANLNLRSETKYAEWIIKELEETYADIGFADLAPLIGFDREYATTIFKIVLPKVQFVTDPRLPGEYIPFLPGVIKYLRSKSQQNIEEHLKKHKRTGEELAHILYEKCRVALTHSNAMITERKKLIKDASNSRPGPSDFGMPHYRAFLANGKAIPTEAYGVGDVASDGDSELKENVKALAKSTKELADSQALQKKLDAQEKRMKKQDDEIAELRAGLSHLLAAQPLAEMSETETA